MKAIFLSTSSGETTKYAESLTAILGAEPDIVRYDTPEATDATVYAEVKAAAPDFIVYVGSRWGRQPSTSTLCQINGNVAPMVHLCSDAADPPWHDLLREYHNEGAFTVQVAIDGNDTWPGAESGLTLLTPIAASHFPRTPKPFAERTVHCGYAGNPGNPQGQRRAILQEMMMRNLVTMRLRADTPGSYEEYCAFLANARLSVNVPLSGTEATTQVKGRVIESGLAGACLLEHRLAPTSRWFTPGVDYLEYSKVADLLDIIEHPPENIEAIGASLRARVIAEHSPAVFWAKVMGKAGLTSELGDDRPRRAVNQ